MAQGTKPPQTNPSTGVQGQAKGAETRPPEVVDLLGKVDKLLREGQPKRALEIISRAKINSPWVTNAAGVCQLRLGNAKVAVDVFRGLVLASGGLILRQDIPAAFKTNYATALLAMDNLAGCLGVLAEVRDEDHPGAQRLRAAVQRWKQDLTLWQKIQWYTGGQPARPVTLDFPPGDLE
jgi:hypothetical protein